MAEEITLKTVLDHMAAMEQRISGQIATADKRLGGKIDDLDKKLSGQIKTVETNLSQQIDAIDERLDEIELKELPKRMAVVEVALGL